MKTFEDNNTSFNSTGCKRFNHNYTVSLKTEAKCQICLESDIKSSNKSLIFFIIGISYVDDFHEVDTIISMVHIHLRLQHSLL